MKKNTGNYNNKFTGFYLLVGFFIFNCFSGSAYADNNTVPAVAVEVEASSLSTTSSLAPVTIPAPVNAPKTALPSSVKPNTSSQLANLIGGLALILVLIYGLSWFVKRFSQGGFTQNSTIKMLSAMPLGTRERLMLVDVGGKQMLLGVTATQINMLHVFDEAVVVQAEKNNLTASQFATTSDFSQKLMAILQQKNPGKASPPEHKNIKE